MKLCYNSLLVALSLIIADIFFTLRIIRNKDDRMLNYLNREQEIIYEGIKQNRLNIYLRSLGAGILLSLLYFFVLDKKIFGSSSNKIVKLSIVFIILYLTTYFVYIMSPKGIFMVEILDNMMARKEWVKTYKKMQFEFHLSLIIGMLGVLMLYKSIC